MLLYLRSGTAAVSGTFPHGQNSRRSKSSTAPFNSQRALLPWLRCRCHGWPSQQRRACYLTCSGGVGSGHTSRRWSRVVFNSARAGFGSTSCVGNRETKQNTTGTGLIILFDRIGLRHYFSIKKIFSMIPPGREKDLLSVPMLLWVSAGGGAPTTTNRPEEERHRAIGTPVAMCASKTAVSIHIR